MSTRSTSIFKDTNVAKHMSLLQDKYDIVSTDRDPNNIVFLLKSHCIGIRYWQFTWQPYIYPDNQINNTGVTSGAATAFPFRTHEFTPGFQWDSCYSIFSFICMFCRSLFVFFYLFCWPLCCLLFFEVHVEICLHIFMFSQFCVVMYAMIPICVVEGCRFICVICIQKSLKIPKG